MRAQDLMTVSRENPLAENPYPYTVELIEVAKCRVNHDYQRPVKDEWVADRVQDLDLVLTVAVAALEDGYFEVLDGQQRIEILRREQIEVVWACVYLNKNKQQRSLLFRKINWERSGIAAFYDYRAQLVGKDPRITAVNNIVAGAGFSITEKGRGETEISAVAAVLRAYDFASLVRKESLTPTLYVLREAFLGREDGKNGQIIKGLGRFFRFYYDDEIDREHLVEVLKKEGAAGLKSRATDALKKAGGSGAGGASLEKTIAWETLTLYNRGLPRLEKLNTRHFDGRSA